VSPQKKSGQPVLPEGKPTLFLVDGPSQMYRAFYAIRRLSTRGGLPTGAVYGFTTMLRKMLREFRPAYVAVAFDTPEPTFRHEIYEEYKANRDETPDDLVPQIPYVKQVCEVLEVPLLERDGWEADDIIATLARRATARGIHTVIITQDKDLFQLVGDDVWVLCASKGEDMLLDAGGVEEKFGAAPGQVADVLALMGDAVDNLPGVPGIGEKGAKALVAEFGSLDALLGDPEKVKESKTVRGAARYAKLLREHAGEALQTLELVKLDAEVPLDLDLEALRSGEPDRARAEEFFREMGFTSILEEFAGDDEEERAEYACVTDPATLEKIVRRARKRGRVGIDTETDSKDAVRARLVGFSLALGEGDACYVPLDHRYMGCPEQIDREEALALLRRVASDPKVVKIGQNLKYDITVLERAGVEMAGPLRDTMVAAYLIDPTRSGFSLDALAARHLDYRCIPYEEVCGKGKDQRTFDAVDLEAATQYAAEDADIACRLWDVLEPELRAHEGMRDLFEDVEMPLVGILAAMEQAGVRVDVKQLEEMSRRLEGEIETLRAGIWQEAGREFNLNSPKQLAEVLYDDLNLPVLRKTQKTGARSTSEVVLVRLAVTYEIPRLVLEYRELQKLKSTYVDALPALVNPDTGRIHPSYNQTVAATGRLSSSNPNIQNIPIRTDLGRQVRRAFVPEEGRLFLAADYSQVELRVLAHLSGDPRLIEAFRRGEDIHRSTAAEVFGVEPGEVTSEQRARAKAVNFGVLYGMGPHGLSQQIGVTHAEAREFIDRYFDRYPGVRGYIDRVLKQLDAEGRVTTLFGRTRAFPEATSPRGAQRSFAERAAINTTIQGTAADLMKMAMIRVARALEEEAFEGLIIMQIHDELVLEAPAAEMDALTEMVRREMEGVHEMAAPLVVDTAVGPSWYDV